MQQTLQERKRKRTVRKGLTFAVFIIALLALANSCRKKPKIVDNKCATTACYNGGTCTEGVCFCPIGYDTPYCKVESYKKFAREWQAVDFQDSTDTLHYTVKILQGDGLLKVSINRAFSDSAFLTYIPARIVDNDISIENFTQSGKILNGHGVYRGGKLTWDYTIVDGNTGQAKSLIGYWQ